MLSQYLTQHGWQCFGRLRLVERLQTGWGINQSIAALLQKLLKTSTWHHHSCQRWKSEALLLEYLVQNARYKASATGAAWADNQRVHCSCQAKPRKGGWPRCPGKKPFYSAISYNMTYSMMLSIFNQKYQTRGWLKVFTIKPMKQEIAIDLVKLHQLLTIDWRNFSGRTWGPLQPLWGIRQSCWLFQVSHVTMQMRVGLGQMDDHDIYANESLFSIPPINSGQLCQLDQQMLCFGTGWHARLCLCLCHSLCLQFVIQDCEDYDDNLW